MAIKDNPYFEHIQLAAKHIRRLETMKRHLCLMRSEWGDLDNGAMFELGELSQKIDSCLIFFRETRGDCIASERYNDN